MNTPLHAVNVGSANLRIVFNDLASTDSHRLATQIPFLCNFE